MNQRMYDKLEGRDVFHAENWNGQDYTLCGLALEGDDDFSEATPTKNKVNCPNCVGIIKFCQTFDNRKVNLSVVVS